MFMNLSLLDRYQTRFCSSIRNTWNKSTRNSLKQVNTVTKIFCYFILGYLPENAAEDGSIDPFNLDKV